MRRLLRRVFGGRARLLPLAIAVAGALLLAKADSLLRHASPSDGPLAARAADAPARAPAPAPAPPVVPAAAVEVAERALLESLRARRDELERREASAAAREAVLTVAERRLNARIEAMAEQQRRLEAVERARNEREDGAWRSLVKTYEGMRPAAAATILQDLEMPVLVQIMDRMGERRAAPILGAMRPDRARDVTGELARHRTPRPG